MTDQPENDKDNIQQRLDDLSDKFDIDVDVLRGISTEEILYLFDHWPFLQLVSLYPIYEEDEAPEFKLIQADSGWKIHDHGDALSSSPGEQLIPNLRDYKFYPDTEGGDAGGEGRFTAGKGTLVNLAFLTAKEMVEIAIRRGWQGIRLIDGHPVMMRSAWMHGDNAGLTVEGYTPSQRDRAIRKRIELTSEAVEKMKLTLRSRGR